ncbi:putative LRR receptor-like serine/threonine-protein kinase [Canna indica]|uniref:LRR receptor-like serine/threonine-protein kinase n=1 Tax=Canna indica TaxID=4628 RepID=A0AAQ3QK12_9LILI|nr:putative LRR receptor-like serine/threonine-protein kinase [Canna indica]
MNESLQIIFESFDNPQKDCCKPEKKVKLTILIPSIVGGVVLLTVSAFLVWWIRRRSQQGPVPHTPVGSNKEDYPPHNEDHPSPRDERHPFVESLFGQIQKPEDYPIKVDSMQFTYMQLVKLTKNFTRNIGRGGFGYVYHGYLEPGTEVAVKIHSQSSPHRRPNNFWLR